VEGVIPSSPVETKHSVYTRPPTAASEEINVSDPTNALGGTFGNERKSMEANNVEKEPGSPTVEEHHHLEEVPTTVTVNKHATTTSEDDDDDDDHIHTAIPPELITNPGDSCAICIDTLEQDDDIRGLTCGHAFHAGCLDPWLTSRRACCPLAKPIITHPSLDLRVKLLTLIALDEEVEERLSHHLQRGLVSEAALVSSYLDDS